MGRDGGPRAVSEHGRRHGRGGWRLAAAPRPLAG
jgi:hypothetical protein